MKKHRLFLCMFHHPTPPALCLLDFLNAKIDLIKDKKRNEKTKTKTKKVEQNKTGRE